MKYRDRRLRMRVERDWMTFAYHEEGEGAFVSTKIFQWIKLLKEHGGNVESLSNHDLAASDAWYVKWDRSLSTGYVFVIHVSNCKPSDLGNLWQFDVPFHQIVVKLEPASNSFGPPDLMVER
jgi:hypothetical protein